MFERLIKWLARNYIREAINLAIHQRTAVINIENYELNVYLYLSQVGKRVIYTSNEWEDPVIGKVIRVDYITKARCPVLVVADVLSGEERIILTDQVYEYSPEILDAILKLSPYQRWNMKSFNAPVKFNKPTSNKVLLTNGEIYAKLGDVEYKTWY
jgi:hypothetical protein